MAEATPQNVTLHLKDIYSEGELEMEATCKECLQVREQADSKAEQEFEEFSARLRRELEAEGERGTLKQLEDQVKNLPAPKPKNRPSKKP